MYSFAEHSFPFWDGYKEAFKIKDFILPSTWSEENFRLSSAYAAPGRLKLFPWQIVPLDSIVYFDEIVEIAAVQTGKSMITEAMGAYFIDTTCINQMWIYSKKEKVQEIFDERLKPMVRDVPAIRKYWNGEENNLTKTRIKLKHLIARIASAGSKTDIASHNAGIVIGDELAKWPKKDFSQKKAIEGRKQASRMMGKRTKVIYCTSPDNDKDPSYTECHKPGTLWFRPHIECPHCGNWQYLIDRQVKEKPNKKGEKDHDTERIRIERAAWYECINCKQEITEKERLNASFNVKWLTFDKKIDFYKIIEMKNYPRKAVLQWNRFVDVTWSFVECLCAYFNVLNSSDPNDLKTYMNEDMADWVKTDTQRFEQGYVRSKCLAYKQYGDGAFMPDGVLVLLAGVDTMDNGFAYVIRGFGYNMESWLVRQDFVHCDVKDYNNPADVERILREDIVRPYIKKSGEILPIYAGLIDRGGHRAKDVDYIVTHSDFLSTYIGTAHAKTIPLIEKKDNGIFNGNTENLSRTVAKNMESNMWHLPNDINPDYVEQVLNHYDEVYVDTRGNKKKVWITKDPDHYRDCEAYVVGCSFASHIRDSLFTPEEAQKVNADMLNIKKERDEEYTAPQTFIDSDKYLKGMGF